MEGEGDGKEREGRGIDIYFKNVPAVLYTLSPNTSSLKVLLTPFCI